ncbi:hypothetical protein ACU4GD_22760 [Cupriavidus basilensis]
MRYRQSLYTAFAEVENALSGHASLALRDQRLAESLQAASRAEAARRGPLPGRRHLALRPWLDASEAAAQRPRLAAARGPALRPGSSMSPPCTRRWGAAGGGGWVRVRSDPSRKESHGDRGRAISEVRQIGNRPKYQ